MNRRIPTLLGLILLLVGVAGGVYLIKNSNDLRTRASVDEVPRNVQVSNVVHDSFTVSWSTQESTLGYLRWGEDPNYLNNTALDENNKKNTHYIQVVGLSASNEYYFEIYSNSKRYVQDERPLMVKTGKKIAPKPTTEIASGKILTSTGLEVDKALVYANISGGNTLSDISSDNGVWLIPISNMRGRDLNNYLRINDEDNLEIFVDAGPLGTAKATVKATDADTIPPVVLGENSDFTDAAVEFSDDIPDASLNIQESQVKSTFDLLFD